jgi:acyl-CoA thioesterase-1
MKKLVCIGDSFTEGLGVNKTNAWPALLQHELGVEVINKGISGDTTGGMVGRFTHDVILQNPSHVLIIGGGNDLWWDVSQNVMLANMYAMIKQALHHGIVPIIGASGSGFDPNEVDGATVWEPVAGYDTLLARGAEYVKSLRTMAENNGFLFLSFQGIFLDEQGKVDQKYFEGIDGLHANEEGHKKVAELAAQFLREKLL